MAITMPAMSNVNTKVTSASSTEYANSIGMKISSEVRSRKVKKMRPVKNPRIFSTCCMCRVIMPAVLDSK